MRVLLVGTGNIARDYVKVLKNLEVAFDVVGRSEEGSRQFAKDTGVSAAHGGVAAAGMQAGQYDAAIVAVSVPQLPVVARELMRLQVKKLLVEKPGAMAKADFSAMAQMADDAQAKIWIAYNRRFYASVMKAEQIIEADGGLLSMSFEFTEWPSRVLKAGHKESIQNLFLCNSTHVVDTAFYFAGLPRAIECFADGSLDWTREAARFAGAGITEKGVVFQYGANWGAPGRWKIELMTNSHRLIFAPLEKLQVQNSGSLKADFDESVDYSLDTDYKPGLYLETATFLGLYPQHEHRLKTARQQLDMFPLYEKIAGRAY